MQIRRPRGVTIPQLMVVTVIGVLGGVYIWQPLLIKYRNEQKAEKANDTAEATTTTTNPTKSDN